MFAKYVFKAGATSANVLADVVKLIADGAINTLSADAVQASCSKEGVATGWTSDDAAYGIVSAPFEDGLSRKVFQLSQAGGVLKMAGLDSWNAATHAGVNVCTAQNMAALPLASGGVVFVLASPEVLAIYEGAGTCLVGAEFPRVEPFFKGRAATAVFRNPALNDFAAQMTRFKNPIANGDSVNINVNMLVTAPMNSGIRGEAEENVYQMYPFFPQLYASGYTSVLAPNPRGLVLAPLIGGIGNIFNDGAGKDYLMIPYQPGYARALGVLRK